MATLATFLECLMECPAGEIHLAHTLEKQPELQDGTCTKCAGSHIDETKEMVPATTRPTVTKLNRKCRASHSRCSKCRLKETSPLKPRFPREGLNCDKQHIDIASSQNEFRGRFD